MRSRRRSGPRSSFRSTNGRSARPALSATNRRSSAVTASIFGALLTAGYAAKFNEQIAASPRAEKVSEQVQTELTKSFSSAANTAEQYPEYAVQIVGAARNSFLQGGDWTYAAGIVAVLLGMSIVFFLFPKHQRELELVEGYHAADAG